MHDQSRQPIGNIPSCAASSGSLLGIYHHARQGCKQGQRREKWEKVGNWTQGGPVNRSSIIPSCPTSPGSLSGIYHHARPIQAAGVAAVPAAGGGGGH
eukprot:9194027-Pyramimonas_sp.AAC.1